MSSEKMGPVCDLDVELIQEVLVAVFKAGEWVS